MVDRLLVVGEQRSGTTLLTDLLDAQPGVRITIGLLTHALRAAAAMKIGPRDPLSERQRRALTSALNRGLAQARLDEIAPSHARTLDALIQAAFETASEGASIIGSKDHEPVSSVRPLLGSGVYILYIVRDARDVALSRARRGERDTSRSTLKWRRSVREALTVHDERFCLVRFEDLARDPVATFSGISRAFDWPLDLDAVANWRLPAERRTNTSFGQEMRAVDPRPVERWRTHHDSPSVRYASTVCASELVACGYGWGPHTAVDERARHRLEQLYVRSRYEAGRRARGALRSLRRTLGAGSVG